MINSSNDQNRQRNWLYPSTVRIPTTLIPWNDHYYDFLYDLGEKILWTSHEFEKKTRRVPMPTFVSRPDVHCYENQSSVKISKKNVTNEDGRLLYEFLSMKSGRAPEWQVAAPATRSEIRDATPRGVEKEGEETPWEYLTRRRSILGGNIRPLVTYSPIQELWKCSSLLPVEKEDSWWESFASSMLNKLLSLLLYTSGKKLIIFYTGQRSCIFEYAKSLDIY